jgi:hypothetical protein
MMNLLAKSSFNFMMKRDPMDLRMNKLIFLVMILMLTCMIGWILMNLIGEWKT